MKQMSVETQRELVDMLVSLQWSDHDDCDDAVCPACQRYKHLRFHDASCKLARLLAKARAEMEGP